MRRFLNLVERLIEPVEIALLLLITAAIGAQVFSRALLDRPLEFPEELSAFALIAVVFLGIYVVERENSHIRVEFFYERMSPVGKKTVVLAGKLLTFGLVLWLLNGERDLFPGIVKLKTTAGDIPYVWIHSIIVVASIIWLIVIGYDCYLILKKKERKGC
jgi:TRAP-type C4-dicarboxylate transport system permease small subunit